MRKFLQAAKQTAEEAAAYGLLTFGTVATGSAAVDAIEAHSWSAGEHVLVAAATAGAVAAVTVVNGVLKAALDHLRKRRTP